MRKSYSEIATWEDKLEDLQAISNHGVSFGKTDEGQWYCDAGFEIKDGAILGTAVAFGDTHEEAVDNLWKKITNLPKNQYLVLDAMHPSRRAFKWIDRPFPFFIPVDESSPQYE